MDVEPAWVGVDWGTSNLRAWGIDAKGNTIFALSSDQGMGKLAPDGFAAVLQELLANAVPREGPKLDVLICGMAGARQGWLEAPYLDAPADLSGLIYGAVRPQMPDSRLAPSILPGVCQKLTGQEDVMRGEETQLLGLAALWPGYKGPVIMPGTHSKWAMLAGCRIERFQTIMTGEIFALLRTHSVLRLSLGENKIDPGHDANGEEGITVGLQTGIAAPERLSANLFKVRSGSLLSGRTPAWCAGYLSGLLIGAEIGGQRDNLTTNEVPLIGSTALCAVYAQGLAMLDIKGTIVEASQTTLAGLKAARAK